LGIPLYGGGSAVLAITDTAWVLLAAVVLLSTTVDLLQENITNRGQVDINGCI
jgi:hypothetical protein